MTIVEVKILKTTKWGSIIRNGVKTDVLEDSTISYLTHFGYDIELIRPTSIEKTNNPDILMFGAIWEIKTLLTSNEKTIKKRFHKASKQASKIIFDLRNIKKDADVAEKQILKLFVGNGNVSRLMLVKKDGKMLDIFK